MKGGERKRVRVVDAHTESRREVEVAEGVKNFRRKSFAEGRGR